MVLQATVFFLFPYATRQNILMRGVTTTALYILYARLARAGEGVGDISFGMRVAWSSNNIRSL